MISRLCQLLLNGLQDSQCVFNAAHTLLRIAKINILIGFKMLKSADSIHRGVSFQMFFFSGLIWPLEPIRVNLPSKCYANICFCFRLKTTGIQPNDEIEFTVSGFVYRCNGKFKVASWPPNAMQPAVIALKRRGGGKTSCLHLCALFKQIRDDNGIPRTKEVIGQINVSFYNALEISCWSKRS